MIRSARLCLAVALGLTCGMVAPSPELRAAPEFPLLDLVGGPDVNGWWLNPQWAPQTRNPPSLPNPYDCPSLEPWSQPCTTQWTFADKNQWKCPDTAFQHVWFPGHVNWGGAVFTGKVYWVDHSGNDDDYNIRIVPDNGGGVTSQNPDGILMEFDSDETIDHFHTSWWETFHQAVDAGHGNMIDGMQAVAFGVLGLDCAHDCHSELHPLMALAIHIKDDPADDQWAIFVRNWGNAGYCSSGVESLDDSISTFAFQLSRPGASSVTVTQAEFLCRGLGGNGPFVTLQPGDGALATFGFPAASKRERINGVLRLQWQVQANARPPINVLTSVPPLTPRPDPRAIADRRPDPEERLSRLLSGLNPNQRAIYERMRPKRRPYIDNVPLRQAGALAPTARRATLIRVVADPERDRFDRQRLAALTRAYGGRLPDERPR
jgi:hypothetical protein